MAVTPQRVPRPVPQRGSCAGRPKSRVWRLRCLDLTACECEGPGARGVAGAGQRGRAGAGGQRSAGQPRSVGRTWEGSGAEGLWFGTSGSCLAAVRGSPLRPPRRARCLREAGRAGGQLEPAAGSRAPRSCRAVFCCRTSSRILT